MVDDRPQEWNGWFSVGVVGGFKTEDADRAVIVRRRWQIHDETPWEDVGSELLRLGLFVDEHVGERRRRVAHICRFLELTQKSPNVLVDPGRIVVVVELAALVESLDVGVDGSVVRLVVYHEQRNVL